MAITVCLAAVLVAGAMSIAPGGEPVAAAFDLGADGGTGDISIELVAGDALDVRDVRVTVAVNGADLSEQPPVPFVGAVGYDGAPTGPFNERADPIWRPGERAALTVADTNDPGIDPGDAVAVTLSTDGRVVARLEATA